MYENLPGLGLEGEALEAVVFGIQEQLSAERGPDFYQLPVLFGELGMSEDQQWEAIHALQGYLEFSLVNAVKEVPGIPQDVKTLMTRALKGALDFVIHDIAPEGQEYIDFFTLLPEFGYQVGEILKDTLMQFDFST